jgi:DNA polymerase
LDSLKKLEDDYIEIVKNKLNSQSRVVFGGGNVNASIVLVGEAPGEKEEQLGKPFVGTAGKNLDEFLKILELERDEIYITNAVKIRPFKVNPETGRKSNRPPNRTELEVSVDTLIKQLEIIEPQLVVTLGNISLRAVSGVNDLKIGDVHGEPIAMEKFTVFPLYHPASIIYKRDLYSTYIEDLHKLKAFIDDKGIGGK